MIKGIFLAARSLNNNFQKMGNIANNLANINTTGYKREIPFSEMLMNEGESKISQYTDFGQGSFVKTSSPLDLAIEGNGFFLVQTENGNELTRNGNFNVSDDGFIANGNGDKLMGSKGAINLNEFLFDKQHDDIKVQENGSIYIGNQYVDSLQIVQAENPSSLQRDSNQNYIPTDDDYYAVEENEYQVMQGYLEESNVNPIIEMESMIKSSKDYQSSYKIVVLLDGSLEKANEIGRV